MQIKRIFLVLLTLGLIAGGIWWRVHLDSADKNSQKPGTKIVDVAFTTARIGAAPIQLEAMGELLSSHSTAIRPQVSGVLTRVLFEEGQPVKAGQALFEIDAAPARAAVEQAAAQVERDRASLAAAQAQAARLKPLLDKGYVTPQEVETAIATASEAAAQVKLSASLLATANINLSRCRINAPIAGRTGSLAVKSGNLVSSSDAAPLVTINQLQPIQAQFSVPQSQLLAVQQALQQGAVKVTATTQSATPVTAEGRLLFVDNSVDTATGTVKLKAEFANHDEQLWPGSFATLVIKLGEQANAVLVPESAVQQGANGAYVFIVGPDAKAVLQEVTVDRQIGGNTVIAKGLLGGETLVARAPRELRPGASLRSIDESAHAGARAAAGKRP